MDSQDDEARGMERNQNWLKITPGEKISTYNALD
jgi:hypothetical protein